MVRAQGKILRRVLFSFFFVTAVKWPWLLVKTGDFYSDFAGDQ
jgi:hypothetical protein